VILAHLAVVEAAEVDLVVLGKLVEGGFGGRGGVRLVVPQ
jgi:hypothetical protein